MNQLEQLTLGEKKVGDQYPTYFIADLAANHDGDLERAKDLIYKCAEAGADAAKFQNFKAHKIVSQNGFENLGDKLSHQKTWKKSVFEVYQDASISEDWTACLKATCEKAGIEYFTSPYDFASVDHVDPFVRVYKIGSGDVTWPEMLEYIASKNKPILLATGASNFEDVHRAMNILLTRTNQVVLMQCNTNYTGSLENFKYINLNVLQTYAKTWPSVVLGLSDHTPGHSTVLGAVALGARVIEKHFTDDNDREGPDHLFSMNPRAWREMVDRTRELQTALGDGIKRVEENEKQSLIVQRRSLCASKDLVVGKVLCAQDVEPLRPMPMNGIPPYHLSQIVGKTTNKIIKKGENITWEALA